MRRFLLHVLPSGFHRIRHNGFLANGARKVDLTRARAPLHVVAAPVDTASSIESACTPPDAAPPVFVCRHRGRAMPVMHIFIRGEPIRAPPPT